MSSMSFDDDSTIQKSGFDKEPRWDADIKWFQMPDDNTPYSFRLVAAPTQIAAHWIKSKKKTGERGKPFNVLCRNFDSNTNTWAKNGCEVCDLYQQLADNAPEKQIKGNDGKTRTVADLDDDLKGIKARISFLTNAISRDLQASGAPANNPGKWSYIVQLRLPQGCANKLKDAQDKFNKHSVKGADGAVSTRVMGLHHAQYGKDVSISYNSKTDPNSQYQVYLGPKDPTTALTDDERGRAGDLVNFKEHLKYPDQAGVKDSLQKHGYYEILDSIISQKNMKKLDGGQIKQGPPVTPKTGAPSQAAAQPAQKTAFDADSEGTPAEPDPAGSQGGDEDDLPVDVSQLTGTAQKLYGGEKLGSKPVEQPVKPPAAQPAQAAAQPAAQPAAAVGKDIQSKITAYAQANGLELITNEKTYAEDLQHVQVGTQVPACFSGYKAIPVCKSCPVKLDCMMVG